MLPRLGVGGEEEAMADVCELALAGALPNAHRGRGWCVKREAAMEALSFVCHSTVVLCFCGDLGFLHKHSWLWSSSLPSPQAVSSQPTAVTSLGLLSKPHVPAPSLSAHWQTPSQPGVRRAVAWTICVGLTLSCLPQTGCWAIL